MSSEAREKTRARRKRERENPLVNGPRGGQSYEQRKRAKENSRYLRKYGISLDERDRILREQEGRCVICKVELTNGWGMTAMHLDHCHATGKVRGILCHRCNLALGHFSDRIDLLTAARDYLLRVK